MTIEIQGIQIVKEVKVIPSEYNKSFKELQLKILKFTHGQRCSRQKILLNYLPLIAFSCSLCLCVVYVSQFGLLSYYLSNFLLRNQLFKTQSIVPFSEGDNKLFNGTYASKLELYLAWLPFHVLTLFLSVLWGTLSIPLCIFEILHNF